MVSAYTEIFVVVFCLCVAMAEIAALKEALRDLEEKYTSTQASLDEIKQTKGEASHYVYVPRERKIP